MKRIAEITTNHNRIILIYLFSLVFFFSKAEISIIKVNHRLINDWRTHTTDTEVTPLFTSNSADFRVEGKWVDLTSNIVLVALDGQSATNISIRKTGNSNLGESVAWVEFKITYVLDLSGRYRVEMPRPGGMDKFTVRFHQKPNVNSISFLNMQGQPVYLNAFPINTDFRVRLSGARISKVNFKPPVNFTVVNQNFVPNTSDVKEVIIRVTSVYDSINITPKNFTIQYEEQLFNLDVLLYFRSNDHFRIYDKPNLLILGSLNNWYRKSSSTSGTCLINNNTCLVIPDPGRCATVFRVPAPSQTTPVTQAIAGMPPMSITIKNDSYAPIFTPFTVEFRFGLNILQTITVTKMIAQEVKTITYTRPQSLKLLYRSINCPFCYEDPGAPYDWQDPSTITVIIDPPNAIAEKTKTDNSKTF